MARRIKIWKVFSDRTRVPMKIWNGLANAKYYELSAGIVTDWDGKVVYKRRKKRK
jgi:hypothetical protein